MVKQKKTKVMKEKPETFFKIDTGTPRGLKTKCVKEVEELLKDSRKFLDQNKGKRANVPYPDFCKRLGVQLSKAHQFIWEFSPSNPKGSFRDLAIKYRIYVGGHGRTSEDPTKSEVTFRDMIVTDIPERDKESRSLLSG